MCLNLEYLVPDEEVLGDYPLPLDTGPSGREHWPLELHGTMPPGDLHTPNPQTQPGSNAIATSTCVTWARTVCLWMLWFRGMGQRCCSCCACEWGTDPTHKSQHQSYPQPGTGPVPPAIFLWPTAQPSPITQPGSQSRTLISWPCQSHSWPGRTPGHFYLVLLLLWVPTRDPHCHLPKVGGLGTCAHGSRCFGSSVCSRSLHIFFTTSTQIVLNRNVKL